MSETGETQQWTTRLLEYFDRGSANVVINNNKPNWKLEPIVSLNDDDVGAWELLCVGLPNTLSGWHALYSRLPDVVSSIRNHAWVSPEATISINIDSWQARDAQILEYLKPASALNIALEWTERIDPAGSSADEIVSAGECLRAFGEQTGIPLWVDDAGEGLDAIGRITAVRPAAIKISGEIFAKVEFDSYSRALLRSLVDLSREVGAVSIIEYIETQRRYDVARALGADCGQGYLWSNIRLAEHAAA